LAKIPEEQNEDNLENEIQIFSNTDEKLKFLGKILNNDSSREIILLLIEKEMTANEIATQTKLSLPLALYHINQMIKAGIVIISKTSTNGKNQPMKYYSAKSGILILPKQASQKARESKSFSRSLKSIMKFSVIGIAGLVSWMITLNTIFIDDRWGSGQNLTTISNEMLSSIMIGLIVIIVGMIIERIYKSLKNKKYDVNVF